MTWAAPYVGRDYSEEDCYTLVRRVLREHRGIHIPDPKREQLISPQTPLSTAENIIEDVGWVGVPRSEVQPFDVVLFKGCGYTHCGIMIDARDFLHTREQTGSCIERITAPMWKNIIEGIYRIDR